ncbi:MAG: dephospho-CoA kinase [Thermodesulfobacteriota bacterium]
MRASPVFKRAAVAITGGIATGKSRVAAYLTELSGAGRLDADEICRDLLRPGEPGWLALRDAIAPAFFLADGQLNRPLLRHHLFADAALRAQVDSLLHPLARVLVLRQAEEWLAAGTYSRLLVEVPLLYEAGWQEDYHRVVVVAADTETCVARLMARDGVSREAALSAMAAQLPLAEKIRRTDLVIDNHGAWGETCRQIEAMFATLWPEIAKNS